MDWGLIKTREMGADEVLTHTVGTKSWIKDNAEGWIKCDVVKVDPGLLTVKTERGDVLQAKPEDCPLQNPLARAGVEVGPLVSLPTCLAL